MATIFSISDIDQQRLGNLVRGVDTSTYDTNARYTPGEVAFGRDGARYRYVQFVDAVAYAVGQVVTLASADGTWKVTNDRAGGSSLGNVPVGVTLGAPAQNQYGWVQIAGIAEAVEHAAVAVGDILVVDTGTDGGAVEADYAAVAHADLMRVGTAIDTDADGAVLLEIPSAG